MAELDRGKPAASAASPIPLAYVVAALPPLFWAGNFLIARLMRDDIPPIQMSLWRWVLALAILLPFAWSSLRLDRSRLREEWPFLALLGAIGVTAFNCFIYTALHHTTVINAALVNSLLPVATILLARLLLGERIVPLRALGIAVSLMGAVLVIARGDLFALGNLAVGRGDILVVLGMSFWALYTVLVRRRPLGLKPLSLLGATTAFGIVFHLPFLLIEATQSRIFVPTLNSLPALVYFAVFPSILAYIFWNRSIATLGPATTGMFMHLMPIFSAILAAAFLGERLAWYHPVAFVVIVGGILLATRRPPSTPHPSHQKR